MNWKVKKIQGIEVKGCLEDEIFASIGKEGKFFEEDILSAWHPYIECAEVIFDIGANMGNHSLYWALYTKAEQIYAFEPYSVNYALLQNNVRRNGFAQIIPLQLAAGARNTYVRLKKPVDCRNLGNASFEYCERPKERDADDTTRAVSLDSFIQEQGIKKTDFVKIDTEGFGLEVLKGMGEMVSSCKPGIWIELEPESAKPVYNYCTKRGYVLADVIGMNALFLHPQKYERITKMQTSQLLTKLLWATETGIENEMKYYECYHQYLHVRRQLEFATDQRTDSVPDE